MLIFSAGGFQAKYGDKLSSVLDITYRSNTVWSEKATFLVEVLLSMPFRKIKSGMP
jgi:hypothetical protein